jgi:hypothetical protein
MENREDAKKKSEVKRRQTGTRIPEDTLRAVRVYAAERDMRGWEAQDLLLRMGLGLPPRKK